MKLVHKLMLGFLAVLLSFWAVGYITFSINKKELQELVLRDSETLVAETLDKLIRHIYSRYEIFSDYSSSRTLRDAVIASNQVFGKLGAPSTYIDRIDRKWPLTDDEEVAQVKKALISNPLSLELQEKVRSFEERYGHKVFHEVFVTNKYGANVAQTGITTDFRQDDEEWWQMAKKHGLYIQGVEYDDSSEVYSIVFGIRINDRAGKFIGVMKVVLNLEEALQIVKDTNAGPVHALHKSMRYDLITGDGRLLYSSRGQRPFLEDASSLLPGSGSLLAEQAVDGSVISKSIQDNGTIVTLAQSGKQKGLDGINWIFMLRHEADEIYGPIYTMRNRVLIASLALTIFGIFMAYAVSRSISGNVRKLKHAANAIGGGNLDTEIDVRSHDEIGDLARSFKQMSEDLKTNLALRDKLTREITEHKKTEESLQVLASIDELTGIPNRRHFDKTLDLEYRRAMRSGLPLSLIMIDIDFFKDYNDFYGHPSGDKCLKIIAETLKESLNRPGDMAARYGGEEFVVVLPDTDSKGACRIAEYLRNKIAALDILHEKSAISRSVTISLGVSTTTVEKDKTIHDLISSADKALYEAKRGGRNRVIKQ